MADVSQALRAARERAGLSLEQVSTRTKIKLTFLQAIEQGQFGLLPGEFFTRAFLRTYAREVHLSPDAIVQDYDAVHRPSRQAVPDAREATGEGGPAARASDFRGTSPQGTMTLTQAPPRNLWPFAALALILVAVVSVTMRTAPDAANEVGAVGTTGVEAAQRPAAERATADVPAARAAPDPERETLTVEIHPSGHTWVTATADGERAVYRLLGPDDRLTVTARNELTLRLGNAAAFEYSINGTPGRVLGREGEVREVRITRDNYRTFLQ